MEKTNLIEEQYNEKGDADYYNQDRLNTIRTMEQVYGTRSVLAFCECNVLKYRLRLGKKPGQSVERELAKARWYERAALYYYYKIEAGDGIDGIDGVGDELFGKHGLPWESDKHGQSWESDS